MSTQGLYFTETTLAEFLAGSGNLLNSIFIGQKFHVDISDSWFNMFSLGTNSGYLGQIILVAANLRP